MSEPLPPLPAPDPRAWLRPELLRSWAELVVMASLVLVVPVLNSTHAALHGSSKVFMQVLASDRELLATTAWEGTFLAFFLLYLFWRGWRPADLRIRASAVATAQGGGLFLVGEGAVMVALFGGIGLAYALGNQQQTFLAFVLKLSPNIPPHSIHVSWPAIFVSMTVNAFFEEITFMGYIFNQLAARCGPAAALAVTVFLRAACHTYQDPFHLAGIVMLFSIYAGVYWWLRKLWPLIFAHLLLDIISLSVLKLTRG
jgi:membrane protease YdiL (CAAX protease family)